MKSKESNNLGSWNGDLLKLYPEAAIEKFLTKREIVEKYFAMQLFCTSALRF